jgi:hypothetical protein
MAGCLGGKLDLVTFMVCIDGSALFLKVVIPSFFVLIFGALCRRCFEDDFLWSLVGVTYEDLVPLWLVTFPQTSLESDSIRWFFELGEFLT